MSDEQSRYRAVEEEAFASYGAGRYAEGAATAIAAIPRLPRYRADLAHLAACLLALAGRPDQAYAQLRAALAAGAWWHRRILVDDDDLAALRDIDGFDALVSTAHARCVAAGAQAPAPVLRRPDGPPVGLLVALHGAGEDADDAARAWAGAVPEGWLLLAVSSTQRNTPAYRSWPEHAVGVRDIEAALGLLDETERALPTVAAGFSAGGRQAIRWALGGGAAAFVAMAPAVAPEQFDSEATAAAAARGVTGRVLIGEADDDVRDEALAAVGKLRAAGLRCGLDEIPGLGHRFPADFSARLATILAGVPLKH